MLKKIVMKNENKEKCSACGGKCCKNNPGAYLPEDFTADQLTKGGMLNLIKNGRIINLKGKVLNLNGLSMRVRSFLYPKHLYNLEGGLLWERSINAYTVTRSMSDPLLLLI